MPADESDAPALESGHRELSGQPHSEAEGRVAEAEAAAPGSAPIRHRWARWVRDSTGAHRF